MWRKGRRILTALAALNVLAVALATLGPQPAAPAAPAPRPTTCGDPVSPDLTPPPLPASVSGRVSFYGAEYDPATLRVRRSVGLGASNALFALASTVKPLIVEQALRDVDAGQLTLTTPLTTTAASRSIELFPAGTNPVLTLLRRALELSDNTAADLLHLRVGTQRLARSVRERSPCTQLLLTGKAAWAAQGGLQAAVLGPDLSAGARRYAALPFEERLAVATRLNAGAGDWTGPEVESAIDTYFHGPDQSPEIDLALQNLSTAKAYTDLMARVLPGRNLKPGTRTVFRKSLAKGCCRPSSPTLKASYWGAKAGSGWRLLTLTGLVETPDGRMFAYTYLNDQSDVQDSEDMEEQIPAVVAWIDRTLFTLHASP